MAEPMAAVLVTQTNGAAPAIQTRWLLVLPAGTEADRLKAAFKSGEPVNVLSGQFKVVQWMESQPTQFILERAP